MAPCCSCGTVVGQMDYNKEFPDEDVCLQMKALKEKKKTKDNIKYKVTNIKKIHVRPLGSSGNVVAC